MKNDIYQTIFSLKQQPFEAVPIDGRLICITKETVRDKELISSLASWRKKVLHYIPSTRAITIRGTREWLQKKVIDEKDRLLFLVVVKNEPIGHVGLYRYNPENNSMVIDNVIRGVPGYPGVMGEALLTLIRWTKKTLHVRSFLVDCSSNNEKAIALYNRIGFKEVRREPLIRVKTPGGYVFRDAPQNHTGKIRYYRVVFRHAGF